MKAASASVKAPPDRRGQVPADVNGRAVCLGVQDHRWFRSDGKATCETAPELNEDLTEMA